MDPNETYNYCRQITGALLLVEAIEAASSMENPTNVVVLPPAVCGQPKADRDRVKLPMILMQALSLHKNWRLKKM